jgi:hypothetical protein
MTIHLRFPRQSSSITKKLQILEPKQDELHFARHPKDLGKSSARHRSARFINIAELANRRPHPVWN